MVVVVVGGGAGVEAKNEEDGAGADGCGLVIV